MDLTAICRPSAAPCFPRMRGDGPYTGAGITSSFKFPPHARGWTQQRPVWAGFYIVSPACAGMDPRSMRHAASVSGFPRMRGDGPWRVAVIFRSAVFPPHARGWTPLPRGIRMALLVSPACAGMDRWATARPSPAGCFPRMRGDGPATRLYSWSVSPFPPHARGWTIVPERACLERPVSPACAGMDPGAAYPCARGTCFPRMRGDGPVQVADLFDSAMFPPHARGWTPESVCGSGCGPVSPACAGMDRRSGRARLNSIRFPRMRGDGPWVAGFFCRRGSFPPHARGWTSFKGHGRRGPRVSPACAGMDRLSKSVANLLDSFPRMRGDGP